ncbi:MAG: hypothetical protein IPJ75_09585 [Ignavibacteriales bacterium]|nr:hypothetical protein [Ignavibacteriales bacterium]
MKDGNAVEIDYFARQLVNVIHDNQDYVLMCVPPSKSNKHNTPMARTIKRMVELNPRLRDYSHYLYRAYDVESNHSGGDRSISKHLNSIGMYADTLPPIKIILLDDIITTGNSMEACDMI